MTQPPAGTGSRCTRPKQKATPHRSSVRWPILSVSAWCHLGLVSLNNIGRPRCHGRPGFALCRRCRFRDRRRCHDRLSICRRSCPVNFCHGSGASISQRGWEAVSENVKRHHSLFCRLSLTHPKPSDFLQCSFLRIDLKMNIARVGVIRRMARESFAYDCRDISVGQLGDKIMSRAMETAQFRQMSRSQSSPWHASLQRT